jgi:hypothetical protein
MDSNWRYFCSMSIGIINSQIGAVGSSWKKFEFPGTTESRKPIIYDPVSNKYAVWDAAVGQNVRVNSDPWGTPTAWTDVTGTGWNGLIGSNSNSMFCYENGFWFFPDGNATTDILKYSTSLGGTISTTTVVDNPRFVIWQPNSSRFVMGGNSVWASGTVSGSTITWTLRNAVGNTHLKAATNGTRVVMIGSAKTMSYIDGTNTATAVTSTQLTVFASNFNDIAYANSTWVTVGQGGEVGYSTTGISGWTLKNIGAGTQTLRGVTFFNGRWYIMGLGTSGGLAVWRSRTQDVTSSWDIIFNESTVATGGVGLRATGSYITFSSDGDYCIAR